MSIFINPFPQYSGVNGQPFDGGSFYFGKPNQDPVDNPKVPFSTKDLTPGTELGARQILDDKGAFQQTVYLSGTYSLALYDKKGDFVTEVDEWPVGEAVIPHDVVADMDADTELNVGDTVLCTRYLPQTNSGLLTFTIVPAGTAAADVGVIDDGRYIALTGSGHEARQEFTNGPPTSLQYGCACDATINDDLGTDDTIQLSRLIDNNQASFIVDAGSDANNLYYRTTAPIIVDSDDTLRVVSSDGAKIGLNHAGDGVFVNGGSNGCFFAGKLGIYGKGTFKADTTGVSANPNSHGLHVKGDAITISGEVQIVRVQGNGVFFDDGSGNSNRTFMNLVKILGCGVNGAFFGNSVANNSNSWEYTIEAKGCRQSGVKYDSTYNGLAHVAHLTTEDNCKDTTSNGVQIDKLRRSVLKIYAEDNLGVVDFSVAGACSNLTIDDLRGASMTVDQTSTGVTVWRGGEIYAKGGDEVDFQILRLPDATDSGTKWGQRPIFNSTGAQIGYERYFGNGKFERQTTDPANAHGVLTLQDESQFVVQVSVDGAAVPLNQLVVQDGVVRAGTDDDVTLGSAPIQWKGVFTTGLEGVIIGGVRVISQNGAPESNVTGLVSTILMRPDGGNGTVTYHKESGASNTGWIPIGYGVATTAELVDDTNLINTLDKGIKRFVINSTTDAIVRATGSGINDTWVNMDGTLAHTPV